MVPGRRAYVLRTCGQIPTTACGRAEHDGCRLQRQAILFALTPSKRTSHGLYCIGLLLRPANRDSHDQRSSHAHSRLTDVNSLGPPRGDDPASGPRDNRTVHFYTTTRAPLCSRYPCILISFFLRPTQQMRPLTYPFTDIPRSSKGVADEPSSTQPPTWNRGRSSNSIRPDHHKTPGHCH